MGHHWRRRLVRAMYDVPERLCGGLVYLGRYNKCLPLPLPFTIGCCNYAQTYLAGCGDQ